MAPRPSLSLRSRFRILLVRSITYFYSLLDRYFSSPKTPQPSSKIKILSTISSQNGAIELLFYLPKNANLKSKSLNPLIINFHGGGWIFGTPQMDARWAARVIDTGAVFVSVGYRLAPEHPFPTPHQDCVDAIIWLHEHAEEYQIDRTKIILSGSSAGGNMVFTTAMWLKAEMDKKVDLAGIISFYPSVDRTLNDEQRLAENPNSAGKQALPASWRELMTSCYTGSTSVPVDLASEYVSPGLAHDDLLQNALPNRISIFTCGWDDLLSESELFRKRLLEIGKIVGGSTIEGVGHAWDRVPTFKKGNKKMDNMYTEAIRDMKDMLS